MVLIGNYSVYNKNPGRSLAGSTIAENRSNWNTSGSVRNIWLGWGGINLSQSYPAGYDTQYSIYDAPRVGGISSTNNMIQKGNIEYANVAGGLSLDSDGSTTGDGVYLSGFDVVVVDGYMRIFTTSPSTLAGSAAVASSIIGTSARSAGLTGFDTISVNASGAIQLASALTATGNVTASAQAILAAAAALTGSGTVTSAAVYSLIQAVAAITASSNLTASTAALGIIAAALAASGNLTAAIQAFANFSAAVGGSGGVTSAGPQAKGTFTASVNVTGDILTSANVGEAVWNFLVENGYSAEQILSLLASVAAGKTDINTVGPTTTVKFRDLADSKDRVTAVMSGSERATVTLNLT